MNKRKYLFISFMFLCLSPATKAKAQIANGGNYAIERSVVANGGASGASASANGVYTVDGTIGQFAAGTKQQNAGFVFQPGFWNNTATAPFVPTAVAVTVGGRVLTADGRGIRGASVTLRSANGETRAAISGAFGYYHFADVAAGETYILGVRSKRFTFSQPTLVRALLGDADDINFVADVSESLIE